MAEDNQVLPAATGAAGAGGMNPHPQIQAFLHMLMQGGLPGFPHLFGGLGGGGAIRGGLPFGGPGHGFMDFLMNNPALMQGLGLTPHGAVPGPLPGATPVQDSTPVSPASAPPPAPGPTEPGAPSGPAAGGGPQGWSPSLMRLLGGGGAQPPAGGTPLPPTGAGNPGDPMWGGMTVHGVPSSGAPSTLPPMLRKG